MKEIESSIVWSLLVKVVSSWVQNLARLYEGVPIAGRIGIKDDMSSSNALWILASQYRIAGVETDGYKSFFSFPQVSPWCFKLLRRRMIHSSIWIKCLKVFPSSTFTHLTLDLSLKALLNFEI